VNAIVLVKQVAETPNQVEWDPATQTLNIDKATKILNPYDQFAVEEAIRMREANGAPGPSNKVVILGMGPARLQEAIRECLAMGADEAVLLDHPAFEGADGRATARALVAAIQKLGTFDVILCGKRAIDGEMHQVGPRVAALLGIPVITLVTKVMAVDWATKVLKAERMLEKGREVVEARLPLVLTAEKDMNQPRYPSLINIRKASKKEIAVWTPADLGIDPGQVGRAGSAVKVGEITLPPPRPAGEVWTGDVDHAVSELVERLIAGKLVG
jgi:electron transfer flavoprotein alpha/beta subunit